ncbi:MAG TPA: hypothetical protein VFV07_11305 [Rhizomicrobium sp.]|nr:hypothetical protein [Rhizomicrobium sp.]
MRDLAPVLGVALGIAGLVANILWPSWQLAWAGIACVIGSLLLGAAFHALSTFERARRERSLALNARAQADVGYWRTIRDLLWEFARRFWVFYTLGIVVSVFPLNLPPQGVWVDWSAGAFVLLLGILLIATLNHILVLRRARSHATDKNEIDFRGPS